MDRKLGPFLINAILIYRTIVKCKKMLRNKSLYVLQYDRDLNPRQSTTTVKEITFIEAFIERFFKWSF